MRRSCRLMVACFLLLIMVVAAPTAHAAERKFYVPPTQFNAAMQVMNRGYANIIGLFQSATGGFAFDRATNTISKIKIAVDSASLMVPNQDAQNDLLTLFDTGTYPEIVFMSTAPTVFQDGHAQIKGTLSVHGVKKEATFDATLNSDQDGKVGLSLRGAFKRADFGMGDEPEMPGRFGDSVTLILEMQAIRS